MRAANAVASLLQVGRRRYTSEGAADIRHRLDMTCENAEEAEFRPGVRQSETRFPERWQTDDRGVTTD